MLYYTLCIIFITIGVKPCSGHDNMTENGAICCGPKGEKGDYGHPGICGLRGFKGSQGASGPKGDQGEPGPTGPFGIQAVASPVGIKGSRGEKGQKEVLVQGVRKDLTGNRVFLAIPVQLVQEVPRERKD
jgi:hypothetical protein